MWGFVGSIQLFELTQNEMEKYFGENMIRKWSDNFYKDFYSTGWDGKGRMSSSCCSHPNEKGDCLRLID